MKLCFQTLGSPALRNRAAIAGLAVGSELWTRLVRQGKWIWFQEGPDKPNVTTLWRQSLVSDGQFFRDRSLVGKLQTQSSEDTCTRQFGI